MNSEILTNFESFKENQIEECSKYTLIVSALPCKQTKEVTDLVQIYCKSTILMSLVSPVCTRPTYEQGISFPVLRKDDENYISLLVDFKANIIKKWKNIGLIYDQTIDQLTVDAIQLGIETVNDAGIEQSYVTKLPLVKESNQLWSSKGSKTQTSANFKNLDDAKIDNLLDQIKNDDNLNKILLIASGDTITKIVNKVSLCLLSFVLSLFCVNFNHFIYSGL